MAPMRIRRRESGFTLVEVVIAILLLALIALPLMMALVTGRTASGRSARSVLATAAIHRVSEHLKAYVTADRSLARGPGVGADGWSLPGDRSGSWALAAGRHELDGATWAPDLAAYGGRLAYDVTVRQTPSGPVPTVTFDMTWDEP